MKKTLEELLEWARAHPMTPAQQYAQRLDFAYGNTKLSNPAITRDMIQKAADDLDGVTRPETE